MVCPSGSVVRNPPAHARDTGSVLGPGRSPRGGNGNPLQYSGLENPTDRGAWRATVHRVAESDLTEATEHARTHVHRVGDAIQPSHRLSPLLLPPSMFPSIRVFSNESALHIRWPKYWSFSFSISPSSEYLGLIFFRIDWFYLFAVQETLKSLL